MNALLAAACLAACVHPTEGSQSSVRLLREAYLRASKLDWNTDSGRVRVWEILGDAMAKITKGWPLRAMGIKRMRTRLEVLGVQAGLVDETGPPKRSMLSLSFLVEPVDGSRDGVVVLADFDRPTEKNLEDAAALLYLRTEGGKRKSSVLRARKSFFDMPGPGGAQLLPGGMLLSGVEGWFGNGPSPSAYFFARKGERWACVSAVRSEIQSGMAPGFRSVGGALAASVRGSLYPKNIMVAHVDANVAARADFRFVKGRITVRDVRLPNAWAVFDDMVGNARKGDRSAVARLCASKQLAERFLSILAKIDDMPSARSTDIVCSTSDSEFDLEDTGDRLHFAKIGGTWKLARMSRTPPDRS